MEHISETTDTLQVFFEALNNAWDKEPILLMELGITEGVYKNIQMKIENPDLDFEEPETVNGKIEEGLLATCNFELVRVVNIVSPNCIYCDILTGDKKGGTCIETDDSLTLIPDTKDLKIY